MKNKKVFNLIFYIVLVVLIILIVFLSYLFFKKQSNENDSSVPGVTYVATFKINGASSIGDATLTCEVKNRICEITMPTITSDDGYVLGWNTINENKALYQVGSKVSISGNTVFYAITYRKYEVEIISDNVDYIGDDYVSCNAYNEEKSCSVSIPNYNKIGYENRGYSTNSDALTGTVYPTNDFVISRSMVLYPIYNTLTRNRKIDVYSSISKYDIVFDIERGCSSTVYNQFFNYFDRINSKAKYLLVGSKISFLAESTFNAIWGKEYVGMNYGPSALRLFDVKCPSSINNNYYATIVHELAHTWDFYYANYFSKNITDESDIINLYTKYSNVENRPFRDYSYSHIREFFADSYRYYYFKYIDPYTGYYELDYPSDIKQAVEKYICITNNGYKTYNCG